MDAVLVGDLIGLLSSFRDCMVKIIIQSDFSFRNIPYLYFLMVGYIYADDMPYGNISLYHYNQNPRDIQNQPFFCNYDQIRIQKDSFLFSTKLAKRKIFY